MTFGLARNRVVGAVAAVAALLGAARADLLGHGGPVRALAITPDGSTLLSGGFDQSAILWSLSAGTARQVLRFHDGAVNAVAVLTDDRFATAGEDGRIALWRAGEAAPMRVIAAHAGPIVGLAVAPDGGAIASASWDGTARITALSGTGPERLLAGHRGNVNAAAFLPDGRLATAGYDATARIWPAGDGPAPIVVTLPCPQNAVAVARDGTIAVGGADGIVRFLDAAGRISGAVEAAASPIIALAFAPDGQRLAAAAVAGTVAILDPAARKVVLDLVGPGMPVWSLAFRPDGRELVTGGGDRVIRFWDLATGRPATTAVVRRSEEPPLPFAGERGAELFRACAACHSLGREGGNRAGPSLHGLFGRRIASAPGYNYSPALSRLGIVWTAETVAALFEQGPSTYTPGTKMPEQTIRNPSDRAALIRFLEKATR